MKKLLLLVISLCIYYNGYNQVINGVVIDKNTNETIPYANIYFSKTSYGTTSDQNGTFKIDISKYSSKPITVSAIGYFSTTIDYFYNNEELKVKLIPKVYNINEAQVSSKSLVRERKKNIRLFREEFLGTTDNSWDCEIINEKDITFNYFNDEDTLKAYASKPLIIKNRALGYNITYYLDIFEYYKNSKFVFFAGNFIFEEENSIFSDAVKKNREFVYQGSRIHFFRSLWEDQLSRNHFRMVNSENKKVRYEDIVVEDEEGNKYLKYRGNLRVYYFEIESTLSISGLVSFEQNGNFDPVGIKWTGAMAGDRIADWLPLDYQQKEK